MVVGGAVVGGLVGAVVVCTGLVGAGLPGLFGAWCEGADVGRVVELEDDGLDPDEDEGGAVTIVPELFVLARSREPFVCTVNQLFA